MLFPSWKSDELFDFSLGWPAGNLKYGAAFWAGCSESHVPCGSRRRELTPVRLCSVRLSWRQRARPSTTLHEIQICRGRLEYFVCITACEGPQLRGLVAAEVVSTRVGGGGCTEWVTGGVDEKISEVCRELLGWRVSDGGIDGFRTDGCFHADGHGAQGEEESD
jgi:hypothetical protein